MSKAIEYYKRKGIILPGHQAEIANWLAENNTED
jgi:hypothetical protein